MAERPRARRSQARPKPGARRSDAGTHETVDAFGDTLERLWGCLEMLIGGESANILFRSALLEARRNHPILNDIDVDASGHHMDRLRANPGGVEHGELRDALLAYIDSIMVLAADLTGEVLVRRGRPVVEQFKQRLEE